MQRPLAGERRVLRERTLLSDGGTDVSSSAALALARPRVTHDRTRAAGREPEVDPRRSATFGVDGGERDEANAPFTRTQALPYFRDPDLAGARGSGRARAAREGSRGIHRARVSERSPSLGREHLAPRRRSAANAIERRASRASPVDGGPRSPRDRTTARHFRAHGGKPAEHRVPKAWRFRTGASSGLPGDARSHREPRHGVARRSGR